MKWFFWPPFLSVSPFLLLNLARRQSYAYAIGLYTRPEIKSWPDIKFCAHAHCVLPRCSSGWLSTFLRSPRRVSRSKNSTKVKVSLQEAKGIQCNHFRVYSFYSPFRFPLILWLKVWCVRNRSYVEMTLIPSKLRPCYCLFGCAGSFQTKHYKHTAVVLEQKMLSQVAVHNT